MSSNQTNRQKLESFYLAVLNNDRTAAEALMHPEFTVYEADGLPYAGVYTGHATWWKLFERIGKTWLDMKIESLSLIGEDNGSEFGWFMRMSGRSAATGKPFSSTIFERWVIKDGKLFEVRPHYWDTKLLTDANTP
jgi:ketosteroid isomerase-like protein